MAARSVSGFREGFGLLLLRLLVDWVFPPRASRSFSFQLLSAQAGF